MADKFRWIEKLSQHPLFQKLVECPAEESTNVEARNLLAERDGEIFVWVPGTTRVLTTNLKNVLFDTERANKYQALLCSSPPIFNLHMLRFSLTGKYLALVSHRGISVIEMPQRWGKFAEYQGGADTVNCRTITVDERFFTVHDKIMVLEAKWHPASRSDSHLVVLVSNNTLRIYNILKPETPEQVVNLGDPFSTDVSLSRSRMTSASAFAIALGETSVAFDFAPPIRTTRTLHQRECDVTDSAAIYPIFVLRENADVFYLVFELGNKGFGLEMVGPLTMHPATENNYGLDACSILCLPSQPPVVVMATANGRIYHCIVLETSDESESVQDDENETWSDKQSNVADLTLYVHECVELQRSIAGRDVDESSIASHESAEVLNSCPVRLYPDSLLTHQYHCCHPSGAHSVVLPWVRKLQDFCRTDVSEVFDANEEALVVHMICTTPTTESEPSPIQGLCVINDLLLGSSLVCLTDRMECVARPLDLLQRPFSPPPNTPVEEDYWEGAKLSPMRHLMPGSFTECIKKILTRNTSTPLLRARSTSDMTQKDCLEILTEAQQVLREEYIKKQNHAKAEIEKRISIFQDQKIKQQEDLDNLCQNQLDVRNKAEELGEKIDYIASKDEELSIRLDYICQHIQTHFPVLSDAEKNMKEELETIKLQLCFLRDSKDQINAKRHYKTQHGCSSTSGFPNVTANHQKHIHSILKNESNTISDLVNQVKDLKLQTGL